MDKDLVQQKDELIELKYEYMNKIKNIERQVEHIQSEIYKQCIIKNNGHKWIQECEGGHYGVTFYYCEYCRCGE